MPRRTLVVSAVLAIVLLVILGVVVHLLYRPGAGEEVPLPDVAKESKRILTVSSSAFNNLSSIPKRYTCDDLDVSPPLSISDIPKDVKSLAIIVYDPDAPRGIFYHWIVYSIPPSITTVDEGVGAKNRREISIGIQGLNDFGYIGYGGPCPPPGSRHRYIFLVLALDIELDIEPGATPTQVLEICRNHVVGYGILVGLYQR
ncbi:MAG: YbhB/YbcL family Raf kinase inhibitor-like protein [Ignisphaera sp.]|uniref:YbhB/YbcL family Raf kinase inhibitor-like protein n=1 Tax=Ignisphaera aggregans TaxID=334771 RepID=A0A7J3IAJ5_9CREN